ncbi:sensor histidine kinase [Conexibacter woesei]|uniref:sensor histidine kinase n=1 Tax=Conexibacter woesei TaxID=191495 RepID=UPI000402562F|nr:histidine kinase [Conexibacter woesei]
MSSLRYALAALFAASVAMAAVMVALVVSSDHESAKGVTAVLGPFIGLSFCGTGVFAWMRRPHNRFGALMTAVGFAWFLGGLTEANDPWVYTLGVYVGPLYLVLVGHMLLAFPSGRLETPAAQWLVAIAYVTALAVQVPFFLLGGDISGDDNAPRNAWAIWDNPDGAQVFATVAQLVAAVLIVWLAVLLWQKRRDASAPQRRAMAPVLWTGFVLMVTLAVAVAEQLFGASSPIVAGPSLPALVAFAAVPWAFVIGLLRSRYSRAGAVGDLVERLNAQGAEGESLRDALSEALGDSSLALAFWSRGSERYVDQHGQPVDLPPATSRSRAVTEIEREAVPVAAIVHDAALLDEPGLVRAAGAAAALALENERLEAELKARVAELQVSRAKVIEVGMAERRALERNLHDGAQQRLVALSLQLGLAKTKLRADPDVAERILDGARVELASALEELRELARGIHPAILTDRGLGPALEALASRAPVPVEVDAVPEGRMPTAVEAVAYFVVAESLTNMAKYAHAEYASVRVLRENGYAVVEIEDNGIGGADPSAGSGLRGLADRLAALDGRLEVDSPPGVGTTVRARIPCA